MFLVLWTFSPYCDGSDHLVEKFDKCVHFKFYRLLPRDHPGFARSQPRGSSNMIAPSVSFHNLENKFRVPRMEYLNPSMDLTSSMGGFHERTSVSRLFSRMVG